MAATLAELAQRFGCECRGDPERVIRQVATLSNATADTISFLASPAFRGQLIETTAGAVILEEGYAADCPVDCLINSNPYATYARVAAFLNPPALIEPGVHPTAVVADDARVAASAMIGPQVTIGSGASVGERAWIGAGSSVGAAAVIGDDTRIAERVVVAHGVRIGRRSIVHPGAVIGADGFGFARDAEKWVKIPQIGAVVIGDDVEIGANSTVDRGTIDDTVIADGVKLDNLVQIAHNVHVGEHTVMAAMSGAAGSTRIGKRCMIGGGVVLINHITICDDVMFLFRSVVTKSVSEPGVYAGSLPALEAAQWRRNAARFRQLDKLAERLRRLEGGLADRDSGDTDDRNRKESQ